MVARCKPLTKDHLPLTTTFPGTKGWSLVTGFTVIIIIIIISTVRCCIIAAVTEDCEEEKNERENERGDSFEALSRLRWQECLQRVEYGRRKAQAPQESPYLPNATPTTRKDLLSAHPESIEKICWKVLQ